MRRPPVVGLVLLLATCCLATSAAFSAASQPAGEPPVVVFLGDSLTAGFGIAREEAFPAVLDRRLDEAGLPARVVNAGVSGDTSAGGLRRLDWVLRQQPDVLVVALGGNDGLRALPVEELEANLRKIVRKARDNGARVLLLGVRMPPSHGREYKEAFEAVYPRVAEELDVPLVPYMLEGIAGNPDLNLPDGIHPTAEGHRRIADNVFPTLSELVQRASDPQPTIGALETARPGGSLVGPRPWAGEVRAPRRVRRVRSTQ
jgi:acyl-CoA thioesterase-1